MFLQPPFLSLAKYLLIIPSDEDDMKQKQKLLNITDPDFQLIGIASHENDYRLAWAINTALNIALVKNPDAIIFHDKYKQDIHLSVFSQEFTELGFILKLFANRGDNFFLLEEYRNIDFFLKIEGEPKAQKTDEMVRSLKGIDIIMGVYKIDVKTINKIQRIIF
jgi:hypothetical protein